MRANEALIAWTDVDETSGPFAATAGQVKVGHLLGEHDRDWTEGYMSTGGAAYVDVQQATGPAAVAKLFIAFHGLVVGDGLDPKVVHEAFLEIDEYRWHIARGVAGASDMPDDYAAGYAAMVKQLGTDQLPAEDDSGG